MANKNKNEKKQFKPVVSVVGHVDHGKTTLLDAIRKTDTTSGEKGGITQSIGASEVTIDHESEKRTITLIDTPGHEAFANMRAQGVSAADIVLLVVAADDGIKPQTKESIEKINEAQIPYIVVFTKIDTKGANLEKVKKEVVNEGILLEGMGGDIPYIGVAAPKGEKIPELLDLIFLAYDIANIEKKKDVPFLGVVIDSKLDKQRGVTASIIVKEGTLKIQDALFTTQEDVGKVRALVRPDSQQTEEVLPGDAVEILGVTQVIEAGSALFTQPQESKEEKEDAQQLSPQDLLAKLTQKEKKSVQIILKTQTSSEAEAVKNSLPKEIEIVSEGQGNITTSEVMMAKDLDALVIGFNVSIEKDAQQIADAEEVFYKSYNIIYEMLEQIQDVAKVVATEGMRKELGQAKVLARFGEGEDVILGLQIQKGRLALGDNIEVKREDKVIGKSKIASLKRGKADVKEVAKDLECGAKLTEPIDFNVGDAIIAYK